MGSSAEQAIKLTMMANAHVVNVVFLISFTFLSLYFLAKIDVKNRLAKNIQRTGYYIQRNLLLETQALLHVAGGIVDSVAGLLLGFFLHLVGLFFYSLLAILNLLVGSIYSSILSLSGSVAYAL